MIEENLTQASNEEEPVENVSQEETETTEESTEKETGEVENTQVEPTEPESEVDITAKQLHRGYTQTRQELSEIRQVLNELKGRKEEYVDEDKPLTKKELMEWEAEKERQKKEQDTKFNQQIEDQLDDLRVRGIIRSKADEDAIFNYAISEKKKGKNKDLVTAGLDWYDLQEAKKEGLKSTVKVKAQVRQEAGSKIGTSQKATGTEQGFDYNEIRSKSFDEL